MRRQDSDRASAHPDAPGPGDWYTVEDPEQARLLTDERSYGFFEPFLARELSVGEAAREVGCSVDTMLYRVRRLLDAGLLQITRTEPRAGRPVRYYRSNADAYFIPFAMTPFSTLEERLEAQLAPFDEQVIRATAGLLRETGKEGRRIFRKSNGDVWSDAAENPLRPFSLDEPDSPIAYDFSMGLHLEEEEARQLQRELHGLFERYSGREEQASGRRYLWRVAFVPAPRE